MSASDLPVDVFSNSMVLKLLDERGRRRLLDQADVLTFQDGAVVVQEGQLGDALFLILKGRAQVSADDMGRAKKLAELGEGAFFGEIAVITNQPRSASVTASGELKVLRFPKPVVQEVLKEYPQIKELVAKVGVARTEDTFGKLMSDG